MYGLSVWIISHGLANEALGWLTNCHPRVRHEQPVSLAVVDCCLANKDWHALDTLLQQEKWADRECLRWAFLSLTASNLKQDLRV